MSRLRTSLPGLDLDSLGSWLTANLPDFAPGVTGRLEASVMAGGKSNLTYEVRLAEHHWIVRRPPLGHVLATAHDMAREYRVMTALADTRVPVPRTLALCEDPGVTGAAFYLMEYVAGTPYRDAADLEPLGQERTRLISAGLVDTLVALHAIDPKAVGLGDFGRPAGFLERQTRRWKRQMDQSISRPLPAADALHALLVKHLPAEHGVARIVHGDFRLDNVLVDANDRPAAVIDWEMATLGDPLTDLALMAIYDRVAHIAGGAAVANASTAPGFLDERELLARYAEGAGTDVSKLGFHLGLASYKLAAILEGIHYRYEHGQTVGGGFDGVGAVTEPLLDLGIESMKEYA